MRRDRRNREGSIFFFTLVTHQRREILTTELGRRALWEVIQTVREQHPLEIQAIVLLPDHLHAIGELPISDNDSSTRWRLIKSSFTRTWLKLGRESGLQTSSRQRSGEQGIWQRPSFLRAHLPRWSGCHALHRLYPHQSREARPGEAGNRLAVVIVSSLRSGWEISSRLGPVTGVVRGRVYWR